MKKIINLFLLVLGFCLSSVSVQAQTAPATQTWAVNTAVVSLPGGKTTFAGVDSGISFTPTPNFDLLERNLISTGPGFSFYGAGFNYRIKPLSIGLNNMSPNVNFLRLQIFVTATVGVDRITSGSAVAQHYGLTAGGGVNYALTKGGMFSLGGKVEYAKFPGWLNNTWIAEINPAIHF